MLKEASSRKTHIGMMPLSNILSKFKRTNTFTTLLKTANLLIYMNDIKILVTSGKRN